MYRSLILGLTAALLLGMSAFGVFSAAACVDRTYTIQTDDSLALTLSADGQALALTEDGDALPLTAGPVLWLRDMSRAGTVDTPNLLPNPGFEEGLEGWRISQQVETTLTVTTGVHHRGNRALQIRGERVNGLGAGVLATLADIPVTPGGRYRLSGYFLSSRGYVLGPSGTAPVRQEQMWQGLLRPNGLYVRWLDETGGQVGTPTLVAPLHWNASTWRKIGGEVRAPAAAARMEVIVVGRLQEETLWVDDLAVVASPETTIPLTGQVSPCPGEQASCLQQRVSLPDAGLRLTVTYTATDHIGIRVEVEDTRGEERALDILWGLPLDLTRDEAWRWWDDARHSRIIHPRDIANPPAEPFPAGLSWTYEHVVSGVWDGWLPVSLYPYALVEDGHHGLALAVSLDSPRLVKLAYDQGAKRYEARTYLGISPQATKVGPRADVQLELYRVDPAWGFRAAMAGFAQRHPAWFDSPRPMDDYVDYERGNYGSPQGASRVRENDQKGIFTAEYIVADAPLNIAPVSAPRPTYTDTIHRVQALAQSPRPNERAQGQAMIRSMASGTNADWQIKHIDEFEWARGQWQAVWYTSVDPDIAQGWGDYLWRWDVAQAISATQEIGAVLDGVMMDNFLSAAGVDLNPNHLALTDTPLTYDVTVYRPGVHNMVNMAEFFAWLRQRMHQRGRDDMAIAINFWGIATPNALVPWIDAFGGEGTSIGESPTNWNPTILDYRRAMAYHKIQSWTNGARDLSRDQVQAYVARALFYGIFPTRKEEATGWEEGSEALLAEAQALQHRFAFAGWEPVTYARSQDERVWIERFGRGAREADSDARPWGASPSGLFFTLYNQDAITRTTTITIEAARLGLASVASLTLTDLATGESIPFTMDNADIRFHLALAPQQTRVVHLQWEPEATPTPALTRRYLPLITKHWRRTTPTPTATPPHTATVLIDAAPDHGPGPLSPLWRPGIVWQGGGSGGSNINPALVDAWAAKGGFDRIGLVRIVPELDSLAQGNYSLGDYANLVTLVRDHGGRLLVKIKTTPLIFSNTPHPPPECPPYDPEDYRYEHRYNKYGVAEEQRRAYQAMIQDFIRYFSAEGETVTNDLLFGDDAPHPTLAVSGVLYEVWDEPNYDMLWCDTEAHFEDLYQLIVEAAASLRQQDPHLLPFTIGGPGWRRQTLRSKKLPAGFGAPDCLPADDPDCGAIRRFYDALKSRGYLENGHISWWSYGYLPTEVTTGETRTHLANIRAILNDDSYEGHYQNTLVVIGEWGPPFGNAPVDLLPATSWQEAHEYGRFYGKNINDDNEVGASLVPARIWDMTRADPPPDFQSYFQIGEWPVRDYLPLFKGTTGVMTGQALGLRKAISNVFLLLNRLQPRELTAIYPANPRLNLVASANASGRKLAVLGWYHPNIIPYETTGVVTYDALMAGLDQDGIGPVQVTFTFQNLPPHSTWTQTLSLVDRDHSNAFTYRHKVLDDLIDHCGSEPQDWDRACVYQRMQIIDEWTLAQEGASVALESTTASLVADAQGQAQVTLTVAPYSVLLLELEQSP